MRIEPEHLSCSVGGFGQFLVAVAAGKSGVCAVGLSLGDEDKVVQSMLRKLGDGADIVDWELGSDADRALERLGAFLLGERRTLDLALGLFGGTDFQCEVWEACRAIPFGETRPYGWIAEATGRDARRFARSVGQALGANPVPIIVPCHRVVGASGALTGFGEGLDVKRALLELEGAL